jgi:hypothetical protein
MSRAVTLNRLPSGNGHYCLNWLKAFRLGRERLRRLWLETSPQASDPSRRNHRYCEVAPNQEPAMNALTG